MEIPGAAPPPLHSADVANKPTDEMSLWRQRRRRRRARSPSIDHAATLHHALRGKRHLVAGALTLFYKGHLYKGLH